MIRDVIDLEATFGSGPDGATVNNPLANAKIASNSHVKNENLLNILKSKEEPEKKDAEDAEFVEEENDFNEESNDGLPSVSSVLEEILEPQILSAFF